VTVHLPNAHQTFARYFLPAVPLLAILASLYADELVYFVTRRVPPSGMECHDSHKLTSLSPAEAAYLHVVQSPERDRMVNAGVFSTAETCDDDEISKFNRLYTNKAEHAGCAVYWGFK